MQFYANQTFIFTENEIIPYFQFFANYLEETQILLEETFYNQLESIEVNNLKQIIQINQDYIEINEFDQKKKNFQKEYLMFLDKKIYSKSMTLQNLKNKLIQNNYVTNEEIVIYKTFKDKYNIESGKIFGVPLVFYDKSDLEHKHSLYLVDYFQNSKWFQLYRKIRMAQEVKKSFLIIIFNQQIEIIKVKKISNYK